MARAATHSVTVFLSVMARCVVVAVTLDLLTASLAQSLQEAQLPQRNSASAVHIYIGWLTDRAMHRTPQNHRGCTISDIQTL